MGSRISPYNQQNDNSLTELVIFEMSTATVLDLTNIYMHIAVDGVFYIPTYLLLKN